MAASKLDSHFEYNYRMFLHRSIMQIHKCNIFMTGNQGLTWPPPVVSEV